jgi:parallel beta-helix repeat protein
MNNWAGIKLDSASNNDLINNHVEDNLKGIFFQSGNNNRVADNTFINCTDTAILTFLSWTNRINNNTFIANVRAIDVEVDGGGHRIYHNNFISNINPPRDDGSPDCEWDNGYPSGGNYWSDYSGVDTMRGANQDISGSDGIGDTPYTNIVGLAGAQDRYPLMNPFTGDGVNPISPYWHRTSPITITAIATNAEYVELWSAYASTNGSYGAYNMFANDTDGTNGWSWPFDFLGVEGWYRFYSIAGNVSSGQREMPPYEADAECAYDITPASSQCGVIGVYWRTTSPLTVTAMATDAVSGVKNVTLWFRFSASNATWGAWTSFSVDTALPWSWAFNFPSGSGYYQFYTTSYDNATNQEAAPSVADRACAYDAVRPTISDQSALQGTTGDLFTVRATVGDNLALLNAYVVYWFGTGAPTNVSMAGTPMSYSIPVPSGDLATLYYRIAAVDRAGNWNATLERTVPISDNDPPVANAGPDGTVEVGAAAHFTASGSSDNIAITDYTWSLLHNGTTVHLNGPTTSFTFWVPGTYTVVLNVSDASGNWDVDSVTVTVTLPLVGDTTPPVASAGADRSVEVGDTVVLDASASTDDVGIVNYSWTFQYNGSTVTLSGQSASYLFWTPGAYDVSLNVSDAAGNWNVDVVYIVVSEPAPDADTGGGMGEYWWVVIVFVAVLFVILVLFLLLKRQKEGEEEQERAELEADEPGEAGEEPKGKELGGDKAAGGKK